jgi:hypothetical protein
MRDLSEKKFTAKIQDLDDTHTFFFRRPTNEEIAGYQSGMLKREGNKIKLRVAEVRLAYGKKILLGFEKGTLGVDGKPISCDSNDADYLPNWKEFIAKEAPELIIALAQKVFEGVRAAGQDADFEDILEALEQEESDPQ